MKFKNFKMWRGRLPHWRADEVTYYVTFRHRRALDESERAELLGRLMRPEGKRWRLLIACVLPESSELIFTVEVDPRGEPYELSDTVEQAKAKAGRAIQKRTGERYPPFYQESFDRIVRDESELEERWQSIFGAPVNAELAESPEEYGQLWVSDVPQVDPASR